MTKEQDIFTTIICHILGKASNDKVLISLSTFKNTLLQDQQTNNEFKAFNTLEPSIIKYLKKEADKEIATGLYKQYLILISNYVNKNDYNSALIAYRKLTQCLITHCNLSAEYLVLKSNNPNPHKSRRRKPLINHK